MSRTRKPFLIVGVPHRTTDVLDIIILYNVGLCNRKFRKIYLVLFPYVLICLLISFLVRNLQNR